MGRASSIRLHGGTPIQPDDTPEWFALMRHWGLPGRLLRLSPGPQLRRGSAALRASAPENCVRILAHRLCRFYEASSFAGHSRRPNRVVTNPYSASATNVVIASRARGAYQADQFVVSGNSSIMKAV